MLDLLDRIVGEAEPGEQLEAFGVDETETTVRARGGEVESLTSARSRGIGIRVVAAARLGYAYTADLSEEAVRETLAAARANATAATPDEANSLPAPADAAPLPALYDPAFDEVAPEVKVETALRLEAATLAADPAVRGVRMCQYADGTRTAAIVSSGGVRGSYRRCDAAVLVEALAERDGATTSAFGLDYGRVPGEVDVDGAGGEAAARAVRLLGGAKPPSARLPVVLDPFATAALLGVIAAGLNGDAVQKGRSLFVDRLGEELAGAHVTLVDDGRHPEGPAAAPWDGEGVPTGRTTLVERGVLRRWLHNTYTARRAEATTTGNATRSGYRAPPGVGPSNLYFEPGPDDHDTLVRRAGTAFYCQQIMGVHSGADPVSGDVSVGAAGLMIRDGAPAEPVREATIAGTVGELLSGIVAVSSGLRFLPFGGGMGGATLLIDEMTLSGA